MTQHLPSARTVLSMLAGFAIALSASLYAGSHSYVYYDLNLHYFAGLVERSGTYTNTDQLFGLMSAHGLPRPAEGVYGTPTLVALLFQPLSFLPLGVAHLVWTVASCAAITAAVRKAAGTYRYWLVFLAATIWSPAMVLGANLGNISVFTTALVLYAFGALRAGEAKRAGVALGVATALKLFPGLLLIVLLFTGQRRAAATTVITTTVLFVLTIPALGPSDTWVAVKTTLRLGGFVHRGFDNVGLPALVVHLTHDPAIAKAAATACLIGAIALFWRIRRWAPSDAFAFAAVMMLVVQSITWRHYTGLAVILPLALLGRRLPPVRAVTLAAAYAMATGYVGVVVEMSNVATLRVSWSYLAGLLALLLLTAKTLHDQPVPAEEDKDAEQRPERTMRVERRAISS